MAYRNVASAAIALILAVMGSLLNPPSADAHGVQAAARVVFEGLAGPFFVQVRSTTVVSDVHVTVSVFDGQNTDQVADARVLVTASLATVPPTEIGPVEGLAVATGSGVFVLGLPLGVMGVGILVVLVFMAIMAPVLAVHDQFVTSAREQLVAPGSSHWLGTDRYGRDMRARIIFGARISLYVGFSVALGAGAIAGFMGVTSAFFGGKVDLITQRVIDIFQAFPGLILAMAIVSVLGFGIEKAIIAIMIPAIPSMTRVVRSQALAVARTDYLLAGRMIGSSNLRLITRYMMPNAMAPWIIVVTGQLGGAILTEASLSFLGLGIPEPHLSWGAMLNANAADYAEVAPWLVIFPGLFLAVAVFGFNVFGDALQDVPDPRLRGR